MSGRQGKVMPSPSTLLRQQIDNLSLHMRNIVTKTVISPLQDMVGFNKIKARFANIESKAYQSCTAMDTPQSVEGEDTTTIATYALLSRLTHLKNEARNLVESEYSSDDLPVRFHEQLHNVEQLMNASIKPFLQNHSLSKIGSRQALETLERWSELYRHGLKATENIPERGEEWLTEAHRRLDLTVDALWKLDVKSEAIATKHRETTSSTEE